MKKKKEAKYPVSKEYEKEYHDKINDIRKKSFLDAIEKYGENVGEHLSDVLEKNLPKVIPLVYDRSTKKWINPEGLSEINNLIKTNKISINEIHDFCASYSNTIRPLAGGSFARLICDSINHAFESENLALKAETAGDQRQKLIEKLERAFPTNQKPDIDIIVYETKTNEPLAIISCKTTFRERLTQTIVWKNYLLTSKKEKIRNLKIFIVTAWETVEEKTMKERALILDGVYVTNKLIGNEGKIKEFSSIYTDLKNLVKE